MGMRRTVQANNARIAFDSLLSIKPPVLRCAPQAAALRPKHPTSLNFHGMNSARRDSPYTTTHAPQGVEWPTWLLIAAIYGSWLAALGWYAHSASLWAVAALAVIAAWYMSLQHELVHNHPTRHRWVNRALGLLPIAVWYPFDIYQRSHLAHHRDERLTYPGQDPESNYFDPADFAQRSAPMRALLVAQRTSLGRFLVTPAFAIFHLLWPLRRASYWRSRKLRWIWTQHLALLVAMLGAIESATGMSPWTYLLGVSYPCLGLAFMRSLYEHRPAALPAHRIVVNEAAWPWRLLYLNNNYHAVHHAQPNLPWYAIPQAYWAQRDAFVAGTGGFLVPGYVRLFVRHAVVPIDHPAQATRPMAATEAGRTNLRNQGPDAP
jgi:fatty acid desaturase